MENLSLKSERAQIVRGKDHDEVFNFIFMLMDLREWFYPSRQVNIVNANFYNYLLGHHRSPSFSQKHTAQTHDTYKSVLPWPFCVSQSFDIKCTKLYSTIFTNTVTKHQVPLKLIYIKNKWFSHNRSPKLHSIFYWDINFYKLTRTI